MRVKTLSQMESGLRPFPFYFGVFNEADEPVMEIRTGEYARPRIRKRDRVIEHARSTTIGPLTIIRNPQRHEPQVRAAKEAAG